MQKVSASFSLIDSKIHSNLPARVPTLTVASRIARLLDVVSVSKTADSLTRRGQSTKVRSREPGASGAPMGSALGFFLPFGARVQQKCSVTLLSLAAKSR